MSNVKIKLLILIIIKICASKQNENFKCVIEGGSCNNSSFPDNLIGEDFFCCYFGHLYLLTYFLWDSRHLGPFLKYHFFDPWCGYSIDRKLSQNSKMWICLILILNPLPSPSPIVLFPPK